MPVHAVKPGECVATIAASAGLRWKDVWEHPRNAELRRRRPNPNVLAPGDEVFVPDVAPKERQGSTGSAHAFVVRREPIRLRLRLVASGEPVANAACTLEAAGVELSGTTDGDGLLEVVVPPELGRARLVIDGRPEAWWLELGGLPPADGVDGARARLVNLGFDPDAPAATREEALANAVREFQRAQGLDASGALDDRTVRALVDAHGC